MPSDPMDAIVNLAKRRGFVFQSTEIYGGLRSATTTVRSGSS